MFPDGPTDTGQRYCVNSLSLTYEPEAERGRAPGPRHWPRQSRFDGLEEPLESCGLGNEPEPPEQRAPERQRAADLDHFVSQEVDVLGASRAAARSRAAATSTAAAAAAVATVAGSSASRAIAGRSPWRGRPPRRDDQPR